MIRERSRPKSHLTWSEKVPERSGKTNATDDVRASGSTPARMGTRCWSGGGREALSLPKKDRGRKHTLACRHIARALATLKHSN